jgi:hypothetical protein
MPRKAQIIDVALIKARVLPAWTGVGASRWRSLTPTSLGSAKHRVIGSDLN